MNLFTRLAAFAAVVASAGDAPRAKPVVLNPFDVPTCIGSSDVSIRRDKRRSYLGTRREALRNRNRRLFNGGAR